MVSDTKRLEQAGFRHRGKSSAVIETQGLESRSLKGNDLRKNEGAREMAKNDTN